MRSKPWLAIVLCACAIVMNVTLAQANGRVTCPPGPDSNAELNGDVDGDGVNDYVYRTLTQKDKSGNTVTIYCLTESDQHGWMFVSYYTDQATGDEYVVGECLFERGQNKRSKLLHDQGPNKGDWMLIDWHNYDPETGDDWHFVFDTATKDLTKVKTGHKVRLENRGGYYFANIRSWTVAVEVQDGTDDPYAITFGGTPLMSHCATNDCGGISVPNLSVSSTLVRGGRWEFSFMVPAFSGTGTRQDPFHGAPASIAAGNALTIGGQNLTRAFVSGDAADPANGGWTVGSFSSTEVTFVATHAAEAWPGQPVRGLFVEASGAESGQVRWSAKGDDICYDGLVEGPGPADPGHGEAQKPATR